MPDGPPEDLIALLTATPLGPPEDPTTIDTGATRGSPLIKENEELTQSREARLEEGGTWGHVCPRAMLCSLVRASQAVPPAGLPSLTARAC